jgi:hypothetical protein
MGHPQLLWRRVKGWSQPGPTLYRTELSIRHNPLMKPDPTNNALSGHDFPSTTKRPVKVRPMIGLVILQHACDQ